MTTSSTDGGDGDDRDDDDSEREPSPDPSTADNASEPRKRRRRRRRRGAVDASAPNRGSETADSAATRSPREVPPASAALTSDQRSQPSPAGDAASRSRVPRSLAPQPGDRQVRERQARDRHTRDPQPNAGGQQASGSQSSGPRTSDPRARGPQSERQPARSQPRAVPSPRATASVEPGQPDLDELDFESAAEPPPNWGGDDDSPAQPVRLVSDLPADAAPEDADPLTYPLLGSSENRPIDDVAVVVAVRFAPGGRLQVGSPGTELEFAL